MLGIIARIISGLLALGWIISIISYKTKDKLETLSIGFSFALLAIGFVDCISYAICGQGV